HRAQALRLLAVPARQDDLLPQRVRQDLRDRPELRPGARRGRPPVVVEGVRRSQEAGAEARQTQARKQAGREELGGREPMAETKLEVLGRYKILEVIGRGAMGVVYKAVDPVIDRVVAIKTINLSLSKEEIAEYEARFTQEIKAAGRFSHPNIVTIYDV